MSSLSEIIDSNVKGSDARSDGMAPYQNVLDEERATRNYTKKSDDYKFIDDGFEKLKGCLYNPSIYALDDDLRNFFYVLAHTYDNIMSAQFQSKIDLLKVELAELDDIIGDDESMIMMQTVNRNQLFAKIEIGALRLDDIKKKEVLTMEERSALQTMIEDRNAFVGRVSEIDISISRMKSSIAKHRAQMESVEKKIVEEQKAAYETVTEPTKKLFLHMSEGGRLHTDGETKKPAYLNEMISLMEKGYKNDALRMIKSVLKQPGDTFTSLLLTEHKGVVNTSSSGTLDGYLETESATVMQNVYNLAAVNREFNRTLDFKVFKDTPLLKKQDVDYILYNANVHVEENDVHREVYRLHLITLSGYHPISWAEAFGLRISGIGKRVLDEWKDGKLRPLTPGDLRRRFSRSFSNGIARSDESLDYVATSMHEVKTAQKEIQEEVAEYLRKRKKEKDDIPMPTATLTVNMSPDEGLE
jgi:hypothetical protein